MSSQGAEMTIGRKLMFSFGAVFAAMLLLGIESMSAIASLNSRFRTTAGPTVRKVVLADRIDVAKSNMLAGQRGMIMFTTSKETGRADASRDLFLKSAESIKRMLDELDPLLVLADSRSITARLRAEVAQWAAVYPEMDALCRAGDAAKAATVAGDKTFSIYAAMGEDSAQLGRLTLGVLESD